jgi:long-subunit acyl-CoA synthetase (AMP-forming)
VQSAISTVNSSLPHYKQVRSFRITTEEFTAQNGLLTANGKLKRDAIAGRFTDEIEEMYRAKKAV